MPVESSFSSRLALSSMSMASSIRTGSTNSWVSSTLSIHATAGIVTSDPLPVLAEEFKEGMGWPSFGMSDETSESADQSFDSNAESDNQRLSMHTLLHTGITEHDNINHSEDAQGAGVKKSEDNEAARNLPSSDRKHIPAPSSTTKPEQQKDKVDPDTLLGEVTEDDKFRCLQPNCVDITFERQPDFLFHYLGTHAFEQSATRLSKDMPLDRPKGHTHAKTIGYMMLSGGFKCECHFAMDWGFTRQEELRRHFKLSLETFREEFCPVEGCQRSYTFLPIKERCGFGLREDKMEEHVRTVHGTGRKRKREDTDAGEGARGAKRAH